MSESTNNLSASPFESLHIAADQILKLLSYHYDFSTWLIVYYKHDKWEILSVIDKNYGFKKDHVFQDSDGFFDALVKGSGPNYTEKVDDVSIYKNAGLNKKFRISTFFGIPIIGENNKIFGVVCAFDPEVKQLLIDEDINFLKTGARMLSTMFDKEYHSERKDITLASLESNSKIDQLTGIYNRNGFIDRSLSIEVIRSERYDQSMGIIILDLENLLGPYSDLRKNNLLKETANILIDSIRAYDICGRIGDYEFSILLLDISEKALAAYVEKIQKKLEQHGINATLGWAMKSPRVEFAIAMENANKMMLKNKKIEKTATLQK